MYVAITRVIRCKSLRHGGFYWSVSHGDGRTSCGPCRDVRLSTGLNRVLRTYRHFRKSCLSLFHYFFLFSSNFSRFYRDFNQRNMLPIFKQTFPISRSLPLHTFRTLGIFRPQSTISTSYSTTIPPISSVSNAPLAPLPTTSLLRSLLLHSITSSPRTLKLGTKVMLANLETIDRNFLLKWGVDKTFYVSIKSPGPRHWCSC